MDAMVKSPENSSRPIEKVTVHPLVLLSIVDHDIQFSQYMLGQVIGVLLGSFFEGTVNVSNSYAGWYSTGPELRENDMDLHRLFHKYVPNPVLVIVDVLSTELVIPTKAYYCDVEEVKENATTKPSQKVFVHVSFEIAADDEAEKIEVEHLLGDVEDTTVNTIETEILNLELEKVEDG